MKKLKNGIPGGLVIVRKLGESLSLENGLMIITVTQVKGTQVRLQFRGGLRIDRLDSRGEVESKRPRITEPT